MASLEAPSIDLNPGHNKQKDLSHEEEQSRAYEQLVIPLKICIICYTGFADFFHHFSGTGKLDFSLLTRKLHFIKRDLINLFIIVSTVTLLASPRVEVSRLYHDVRGQAHLKLYVIFGVLEVMDKLLSSIGQEIFTVLVGIPVTNTNYKSISKLILFVIISLVYSACHSYVLIYQSVSLHVAANSYSNALMTLLLSNQFAELKGAVFKKFDREGLFQVAMSDLTERFQLSLMLSIISIRNLAQLNMTQLGLVVPDSWKSWNKWFGAIFGPSIVVLGSEVFVDWLKHCFIIKFNRIKPRVYKNFLYVSSTDFMEVFTSNSQKSTSHEISDYVILAKRIGLPMLSLSICFLRMTLRDLKQIYVPSPNISSILSCGLLATLTFITLVIIRLVLGLWLLKWAKSIKGKHEEYQKEVSAAASTKAFYAEESSVASMQEGLFDSENSRGVGSKLEGDENSHFSLYTDSNWSREMSPTDVHDTMSGRVYDSSDSQSEIEQSFIPGIPNTESSSINPRTRGFLYDYGESVPPNGEERRNDMVRKRVKSTSKTSQDLGESLKAVHRYEMSSKRIW
ncbi:hypothetical protein ACQ2H7_001993 [Candidozyma auris]